MKKIIPLLLCVVFLCSCSRDTRHDRTIFSMDTQIELSIYGRNGEKMLDKAEEEIKRINEKYSVSNVEKSILVRDEETVALIAAAQKIKDETGGAFDINVAPIMRIWGFYSEEFGKKDHRVPTQSEINEALSASSQGAYLDFGAIAKGYCADKISWLLRNEGVESAVLSLGGNVALIGAKPDGTPWTVGIQNPFDAGLYATIRVRDTMVVTSGDYVRYFEENGKRYHHIINPYTGYPADTDLTSVTVISNSGATADALSTALFVMGKDKAIEYWQTHGDFELVLITKDGTIHSTEGVDIQTENKIEKIKEQ